jgi:peptidoglycan/LPS O-acetylase OafA/YrhL
MAVASMSDSPVRKLNPLTSLRIFAAGMIVLAHAAPAFRLPIDLWKPLALNNGVSFFFVLSGFILTYVYSSQQPLARGRFLLARVARIWPAHVTCLLLCLLIFPRSQISGLSVPTFLANLTLVHSWIPRFEYVFSYNPPSWSVSVEMAFYLSFPFLIRDWKRTGYLKLAASFVLLIGTMLLANALVKRYPANPRFDWSNGLMYFHPLGRMFEFVLGMTTAMLWKRWSPRLRWGPVWGTAAECGCVLAVVVVMMGAYDWSTQISPHWLDPACSVWLRDSGLCCGCFAVLIFVMACGQGALSWILSRPFLVLLGEISYSVYLVHFPLAQLAGSHFLNLASYLNWTGFALFCVLVLAMSYLIWALIERPCRHFLVRLYPTRSNAIAVELPASSITPEGAPVVTRRNAAMVLPSWWGVSIAAVIFLAVGIPAWRLCSTPVLGKITLQLPQGAIYAGCVDAANDESISGWAWNSQDPHQPVTLDVYDGTRLLKTFAADLTREDLLNVLGDTDHAYVIPTPKELKDGNPHDLHVRIAHHKVELTGSPRPFPAEKK